jgi:hypothetical protein
MSAELRSSRSLCVRDEKRGEGALPFLLVCSPDQAVLDDLGEAGRQLAGGQGGEDVAVNHDGLRGKKDEG